MTWYNVREPGYWVRWVQEARGSHLGLFVWLELTTSQGVYNTLVPDVKADGGTVSEDGAAIVTHLAVLRVDVHCWG